MLTILEAQNFEFCLAVDIQQVAGPKIFENNEYLMHQDILFDFKNGIYLLCALNSRARPTSSIL